MSPHSYRKVGEKGMETTTAVRIMDEYNKQIRMLNYRISSAEAKITRVDPLSEEFDETVSLIEKCLDEIQEIQIEQLKIKRFLYI